MTDATPVSLLRPATGGAVGHLPDGRAIFVRLGLPGEDVTVDITEEHAKYARGVVRTVVTPSPDRVTSPCAYFRAGGCGGCDLLMASPSAQISWKQQVVRDQLQRVGGVAWDGDIEVPVGVAGRTRLRCAVDRTGHLALRQARSHDLIALNACHTADPRFGEGLTADWSGAREVELRALGDEAPFAVVTMHDGTVVTSDLDGLIDEERRRSAVVVRGHRYRISPTSFWQVDRRAPETLIEAVLAMAKVRKGMGVADLYAGVGLFTVPLAKVVGDTGSVVAVEAGGSSAADARRNVADLPHVSVVERPVTPKLVQSVVSEGDVVVVDPPRTGLGLDVTAAIAAQRPSRVVYVSCDVATFARDAKVLLSRGWTLEKLRAFDLFPGTEHVELVAAFRAP
jgi:tRNA/tmRNA/rRNA uracil-C5-methylase (TrmA/RlmC/RlmD family)